jgi:hypothetical protein
LLFLGYNRDFNRIRQYIGGSFEASVLRYLLNEDYNDWDYANGDVNWDHCKIPMPPTPSRESGSNYQLSDGTPSWAGAINNACDSRYSFLIALEGSLLT